MNPKVITALDVVSIISIEDCRLHLRVTPDGDSPPFHPDDTLILDKLAQAREWAEGYTGLALTPRTLELALDQFPASEILLPIPPTVSVVSVVYTDVDGVATTVDSADYVVDSYQTPGWLIPAYGVTSWPATKNVINSVIIRYNVGYSLRTDVQNNPLPRSIRSALLLLMASLYENREGDGPVKLESIPIGVMSMLDWERNRLGMA